MTLQKFLWIVVLTTVVFALLKAVPVVFMRFWKRSELRDGRRRVRGSLVEIAYTYGRISLRDDASLFELVDSRKRSYREMVAPWEPTGDGIELVAWLPESWEAGHYWRVRKWTRQGVREVWITQLILCSETGRYSGESHVFSQGRHDVSQFVSSLDANTVDGVIPEVVAQRAKAFIGDIQLMLGS